MGSGGVCLGLVGSGGVWYGCVAQSDLPTPAPGSLRISPRPQMGGGRLREFRGTVSTGFYIWKPTQSIAKINRNHNPKSVQTLPDPTKPYQALPGPTLIADAAMKFRQVKPCQLQLKPAIETAAVRLVPTAARVDPGIPRVHARSPVAILGRVWVDSE